MRTTMQIITGLFLATSALIDLPLAAACDDAINASKTQRKAEGMCGSEGMKGEEGMSGSKPSLSYSDPAESQVTTFRDGPTGYVFVYTAEGWTFVGGEKK